jgi:hypothetical protein
MPRLQPSASSPRSRRYTITIRTHANPGKISAAGGTSVTASVDRTREQVESRVRSYSFVVLGDSCVQAFYIRLRSG